MFSPSFTINNTILKHIAAIEAAKEIIENAPLVPAWERRFREETAIRTVHHSTHVEGNPLSYTQAEKILQGKSKDIVAKKRDIQEIINYRKVIKYIESYHQQNKNSEIDEEVIKVIHALVVEKIVLSNQAGEYRTPQVSLRSNITGEIIFLPPPSREVPKQIKDFLYWFNSLEGKNYQPLIKAGIALAEIARIHPFVEGNGRTARAVATLSLYLDGYDIKRFFCLDEYYDQDPHGYYVALGTYQNLGDNLTSWLEYFTEGLAAELNRVKEKVLGLSRDHQLKQKIGQIMLSDRQERILKFVEKYGQIRNRDWQRLFPHISDDTILREIKDLNKKKVLRKRGRTKAAYYEMR